MNPPCLSPHKAGVVLAVRVSPRAAASRILGMQGEELKISLHAAPTEGQANRELIQLLSKAFSIAKSQIEILSGESSRSKRILIREIPIELMTKNLNSYLAGN